MSRLGLGLGLSKGRAFSPFDPLSLNPILAYEASRSMMAPLASESLDLDPATPSSLDIITATRAGTATYTDASGNIQTASPNTVRVDHVQGEELTPTKYQRVKYTDFSSGWINNGSSDVAGSGYSGEPSVVITGTQNNASLFFYCPAVVGQEYIISMYIRRVSGTGTIRMRHVYAVEGQETDVTITNDWSRVEVPFTANSTSIPVGPQMAVNGDSIEIAMPQVEEGTTASDFVENTTGSPKYFAAATYAPRVPMMLIEPAATNLVENSEDFNGVGWIYSSDALETESNSILSPMGVQTADKISKTTTRVYAYAFRNQTVTSGQAYTWSVFMKKGTHDLGFLSLSDGDTTYKAFYDLTDGTSGMITGSTTTSIEDVGNGWFRCSLRGVSSTSDVSVRFGFGMSYSTSNENWPSASQGDGLYVYIWGAQLEEGTVATSYIPTSGSAVTRNSDDLVIDGSDFTDFFNTGGDGTFYAEAVFRQDNNGDGQSLLYGQSSNCRFLYGWDGWMRAYDGATIVSTSPASFTVGNLTRIAVTFNSSTIGISLDGGSTVSGSHNGNLSSATELNIGKGSNYYLNGHIKRVIYWPHHSDNL